MRNVLTSKLPKKKEEEEEKYHLDYIGEDGYVYKHNGEKYYKTGIFLQGPKGQPGIKGKDGLIPRIGENGNWFIGDTDTFVKAALDTSLYATKKDLDDLIDNAPEVLNTLKELANAIGDDADFATNINNRLTDIENVAYQVPVGGIPESDLSQGVKDKMNEKEVFWATYGTTTAQEIIQAHQNGKDCLVYTNNKVYRLTIISDTTIDFYEANDAILYFVRVDRATNNWASANFQLERSTYKKTAITGNESSNSYYPSTKAVADYVHQETAKWGVVSQTQTWNQASDGGYDYTMSNLQYGWIPQANIDLYESAGAVFNEQSGYFELNGLVDISYEEMKVIYDYKRPKNIADCVYAISNNKLRTNFTLFYAPSFGRYGNTGTISINMVGLASNDTNLSILSLRSDNTEDNFANFAAITSIHYAFYNCWYLKEVVGIINTNSLTVAGSVFNAFFNCFSLEEIRLNKLKISVDLSYSPRLSVASILYMINKSQTNTITITLHPTAYARAIADSDVQAALQAHTNVSLASAT